MSEWGPGVVILSEYTIEKELGRGGMGRVWLVKSNSTGRRFAVKQTLIRAEKHRKAFLTELQIWIDLPEHPNIVPCRFFRTVGDEIVIFADYIEGGSLADWIAKGKLTGLEQILDVAIQFAWGLHAIHERGLIHQDVKPGNVLMTSDGVPMVTDFGLARARLRAADGGFVSPDLPPGQQSVLVSSGGMTPAYASPEQRSGKPLSRKTDIWSWGVSVLDMFMGGVSCPHGGHIAADVLANLKESGQAEQWLPQVPDAIAVALGRCFDRDPAARWRDLAQSIEALKQAAPSLICRCATLPSFIEKDYYKYIFTKTRRIGNAKWRDPSEWLRVAYAAVGGTPPIDFTAQRHSSANRLSAGVDDLRILEEAQSVLEKGIAKGTKVLRILLAALFADKALVLVDVDDTTGAVLAYDQGARILESVKPPLPGYEDDLAAFLADFYMHKGLVLSGSRGLKREAVEPLDKSIAIYTKLVAKRHSTEVVLRLARALGNKARLLRHVTETEGALRLYEQAMSLLQAENPDVVEEDMARLCSNTGVALCDAHRERDGLPYLNRAIDLYSSMSQRSMRPDWMSLLANACTNKAAALIALGDANCASAVSDRAISIYRRLRIEHLDKEAAPGLAGALMNRAAAAKALGPPNNALSHYDEAIDLLTQQVEEEGRIELGHELAKALSIKAATLHSLGDRNGALTLFEKSVRIWEHINRDKKQEMQVGMYEPAKTYMNMASIMKDLGRQQQSIELYDRAIGVWFNALRSKDAFSDPFACADLANAYLIKAIALKEIGCLKLAADVQKDGVRLYETLHAHTGMQHTFDLAKAYMSRGMLFQEMGDVNAADDAYAHSIILWESLVRRDGPKQWAGYIADACLHRARALKALGNDQEAHRQLFMAQHYAVQLRN